LVVVLEVLKTVLLVKMVRLVDLVAVDQDFHQQRLVELFKSQAKETLVEEVLLQILVLNMDLAEAAEVLVLLVRMVVKAQTQMEVDLLVAVVLDLHLIFQEIKNSTLVVAVEDFGKVLVVAV